MQACQRDRRPGECCRVSHPDSYGLATATDQGIATREIPDHEALGLLGGQDLRSGMWKRFSIFLLLFGVLLLVIVGAVTGS